MASLLTSPFSRSCGSRAPPDAPRDDSQPCQALPHIPLNLPSQVTDHCPPSGEQKGTSGVPQGRRTREPAGICPVETGGGGYRIWGVGSEAILLPWPPPLPHSGRTPPPTLRHSLHFLPLFFFCSPPPCLSPLCLLSPSAPSHTVSPTFLQPPLPHCPLLENFTPHTSTHKSCLLEARPLPSPRTLSKPEQRSPTLSGHWPPPAPSPGVSQVWALCRTGP